MEEKSRNSDLVEMGVDEYAPQAKKQIPKKAPNIKLKEEVEDTKE